MLHDPQTFKGPAAPRETVLSLWHWHMTKPRPFGVGWKPRAEIAAAAAAAYGLTPDELKAETRVQRIAWPRMAAMALMHEHGWSFPQAGAYFGLDHTTAIHAWNRWKAGALAPPPGQADLFTEPGVDQ